MCANEPTIRTHTGTGKTSDYFYIFKRITVGELDDLKI